MRTAGIRGFLWFLFGVEVGVVIRWLVVGLGG